MVDPTVNKVLALRDAPVEPAGKVGAVFGAVGALLALAVAFGLRISGDQTAAILGVVLAVGPIVQALITRSKVFAPATVQQLVRSASQKREAGSAGSVLD